MSNLHIKHQIHIQPNPDYWLTVEDIYLDVGCDGLTISCWHCDGGKAKRDQYICIDKDSALDVADAIYKLFKKEEA